MCTFVKNHQKNFTFFAQFRLGPVVNNKAVYPMISSKLNYTYEQMSWQFVVDTWSIGFIYQEMILKREKQKKFSWGRSWYKLVFIYNTWPFHVKRNVSILVHVAPITLFIDHTEPFLITMFYYFCIVLVIWPALML